jgi:hypothetical protein
MSKLLSFAAGFGSGYLKAKDKEYERQRQDKLDQMAADQHKAAMDNAAYQEEQRNRARDAQKIVDDASRAGTVQEETTPVEQLETGWTEPPSPKTEAAPKVEAPKLDGEPKVDLPKVDTTPKITDTPPAATATPELDVKAPAAPDAPKAAPTKTYSVTTLDGSKKLFTGMNAAADAKAWAEANPVSSYHRYRSMAERLEAKSPELAQIYLNRAREADKEGAFRVLTMLDAGKPEDAAKFFNGTGMTKLPEGASFKTLTEGGRSVHQLVGKDGQVLVPNVESYVIDYLSGADGRISAARARAEKMAAYQAKRMEPYTLKPGEKRMAYDITQGKDVEVAYGSLRPGEEMVVGPNGEMVLRKIDSGKSGGSGGTTKDDEPLGKVLKFIAENSTFKDMQPTQAARVQTLARQFLAENPGVDPAVAADVAVGSVVDPTQVKLKFDPKSGQVVDAVEFRGGNYILERRGTPSAPRGVKPEQLRPIADEYLASLPKSDRSTLVAAAFSPEARRDLNTTLAAGVRTPERVAAFKAKTGREPAEADFQAASKAAIDAAEPALNLISLYGFGDEKSGGRAQAIRTALEGSGYTVADGKVVPAKIPDNVRPIPAAGGMAPPPEIAARIQQSRDQADIVRSARALDAQRRTKDVEARKAEIAWLTPEAAKVLKPDEARNYYNKYSDVLSSEVLRALRRAQ